MKKEKSRDSKTKSDKIRCGFDFRHLLNNKVFQVLVVSVLTSLIIFTVISSIGFRHCGSILYQGCGIGNLKICTLNDLYGIGGVSAYISIPFLLLLLIGFWFGTISYFYLDIRNKTYWNLAFIGVLISSILVSIFVFWYFNRLYSKSIICTETKYIDKDYGGDDSTSGDTITDPNGSSRNNDCGSGDDWDCVPNDETYCEAISGTDKKHCKHSNLSLGMDIPTDWSFDVKIDDVTDNGFKHGYIEIRGGDLLIAIGNEGMGFGCGPQSTTDDTTSICTESLYLETELLILKKYSSKESIYLGGVFEDSHPNDSDSSVNYGGVVIKHISSTDKEFTLDERESIVDFVSSFNRLGDTGDKYLSCDESTDAVDVNFSADLVAGTNDVVDIFGLIKGSACFEGDCAIYIIDKDSNIIIQSFIWVDNWSTTERVEYNGLINMKQVSESGDFSLVIRFDNPKGDSCTEYIESITIK